MLFSIVAGPSCIPTLRTRVPFPPHPRQHSLFSRSVSDSLRPHGLQHARLPCPSPALVISCLFVFVFSDRYEGGGFEYREGCDSILRLTEDHCLWQAGE